MGSQVNFYLHPRDEEQFYTFIMSEPAVVILYRSRSDRPMVPVELPLPDAETQWCGFFSLWNSAIVAREWITPPGRLPGGHYQIHAYVYPVVEWWRSSLAKEGLVPGRLWATFEHECLSSEQQREFRAWFRRLASWLNKLPYRWDMYRIGPHAKAYFDAGGKAVGYGLGEVKAVEAIGPGERLVRRGVKRSIMEPEIERDEGEADLTIELDE